MALLNSLEGAVTSVLAIGVAAAGIRGLRRRHGDDDKKTDKETRRRRLEGRITND